MKKIDPPPATGIYQDEPHRVLETPEEMLAWFRQMAQESSQDIEIDLSKKEAIARKILLENGCVLDHTIPQPGGVDEKGQTLYRCEWPCVVPPGSPPVVRDARNVLSLVRDVRTWRTRDPNTAEKYLLMLGQLFHQMQVRRFEPLVVKGRKARQRGQTASATRREGTKEDWEVYMRVAKKYRERNPKASISGTAQYLAKQKDLGKMKTEAIRKHIRPLWRVPPGS